MDTNKIKFANIPIDQYQLYSDKLTDVYVNLTSHSSAKKKKSVVHFKFLMHIAVLNKALIHIKEYLDYYDRLIPTENEIIFNMWANVCTALHEMSRHEAMLYFNNFYESLRSKNNFNFLHNINTQHEIMLVKKQVLNGVVFELNTLICKLVDQYSEIQSMFLSPLPYDMTQKCSTCTNFATVQMSCSHYICSMCCYKDTMFCSSCTTNYLESRVKQENQEAALNETMLNENVAALEPQVILNVLSDQQQIENNFIQQQQYKDMEIFNEQEQTTDTDIQTKTTANKKIEILENKLIKIKTSLCDTIDRLEQTDKNKRCKKINLSLKRVQTVEAKQSSEDEYDFQPKLDKNKPNIRSLDYVRGLKKLRFKRKQQQNRFISKRQFAIKTFKKSTKNHVPMRSFKRILSYDQVCGLQE
ncbi:HOAR [Urbanus proteus nucleopolyhedrovirus]|uniref:HOAR n=1 Tax=Urbanus proteus nucleopolyhedrovirus TaxID=1675866 RepID=A0A162GUD9_9ABAC|nr:HOAR [Urbanus proteus nucleopolyhedrovirus]AKR17334.1 HOAR [Urbanus proteus nucleopolyhedrovirus]